MDIDKLDVNVEEEDPWEEIPGCELDGIGVEEDEMWDPKAVCEARSEEVNFVKSLEAREEASREECWQNAGREPIARSGWTSKKGGSASFRSAAG